MPIAVIEHGPYFVDPADQLRPDGSLPRFASEGRVYQRVASPAEALKVAAKIPNAQDVWIIEDGSEEAQQIMDYVARWKLKL